MSGILVADNVRREVVYDTTCYEEDYKFSPGTQVFLQISKVAPPQGIELYAAHDAVTIIDGVLSIITGSLQAGMVFTPPPANLAMGILAGFGTFISAGLKFIPGKPDPVKEKMELLKKKIKELDKIIEDGFGEMKVFITENKFSIEIIGEVATLKKFMNDVIFLYNEGAINNFREAYNQNTPLDIAYNLMSLLAQRSTNPIAMAMEKDRENQEKAFEKWKNTIDTIVGDLLFLEGIAAGLLKDKDMQDGECLIEVANEIRKSVNEWGDFYVNNSWNEFKSILPNYLKNSRHLNNAQKADEIKLKLERACPEYSFFICIMDATIEAKDIRHTCSNPNELIESDDILNCVAFVYRSRKAKIMNKSGREKAEKHMKLLVDIQQNNHQTIRIDHEVRIIPYNIDDIKWDGFAAIIDNKLKPVIRSANWPSHEQGPGCWKKYSVKNVNYTMIVGLP